MPSFSTMPPTTPAASGSTSRSPKSAEPAKDAEGGRDRAHGVGAMVVSVGDERWRAAPQADGVRHAVERLLRCDRNECHAQADGVEHPTRSWHRRV